MQQDAVLGAYCAMTNLESLPGDFIFAVQNGEIDVSIEDFIEDDAENEGELPEKEDRDEGSIHGMSESF